MNMRIQSIQKTLLLFAGLLAVSVVFVTRAQERGNGTENIFLDFDQDGLSNDEEMAYGTDPYNNDSDGDGYSDYTEISSGYDPLVPAPGDRIVKQKSVQEVASALASNGENLSESVATDLALVMSQAAEGGEVDAEELDAAVEGIVDQGLESIETVEIDVDKLTVKEQSYKKLSDEEREEQIKEDAEEYIGAVAYVMAVSFPKFFGRAKQDPEAILGDVFADITNAYSLKNFEYIDDLSLNGENALEQMYDIEVPETFIDLHVQGMQFASYAKEMKESVVPSLNDPLENITHLSLVQGLLVSGGQFITDIDERMRELGIHNVDLGFIEF